MSAATGLKLVKICSNGTFMWLQYKGYAGPFRTTLVATGDKYFSNFKARRKHT